MHCRTKLNRLTLLKEKWSSSDRIIAGELTDSRKGQSPATKYCTNIKQKYTSLYNLLSSSWKKNATMDEK